MKICGITTKAVTIKAFMLSNLSYMVKNGYEAFCVCQPDSELQQLADESQIKYIPKNLYWGNVSPIKVIKNIISLYRIFRREKFNVIQYATSNAALYASIAGLLARIPVRIYCQWGISYTDYSGVRYVFYKFMEKVTCWCSTKIQPDSHSNLRFSISQGLYKKDKGCVLYNGSACGVDLKKYDISRKDIWSRAVRQSLNIDVKTKIFGFVGRVVPEKGINELLNAFMELDRENNAILIVVGPLEDAHRLDQELFEKSKHHDRIIYTGAVSNAAQYFAVFDYLLLPSYREGFGMTVLEAAALGTPSIITDINGPTDFVIDGFNGIICEVKSFISLKKAMERALTMDINDYCEMSKNAYTLVKEKYDSKIFSQHYKQNREELINNIK